jgi:excisionase family DNA binding protein
MSTNTASLEPPSYEPLLNDEQAALFLGGMHVKTLQRMAREKKLPSVRIGKFWYFRASDLDNWIVVHSTGRTARVI